MNDYSFKEQVQEQVQEGYQTINNKWLRFHFHLLFCCTFISGVVESLMFFIINKDGSLSNHVGEYWMKYVIIPLLLNFCIVCFGYFVLISKKLFVKTKRYIISLLFVGMAFVLQLMHSGFVAVLVAALFPILMTIMYESQRLTAIIAVFSAITQIMSGYCIFWDLDKVVDNQYKINLVIMLTSTFCTWIACKYMIDFVRIKREIILNNDIERYRLQRDINMDGLTGVGNKLALLARIDVTATEFKGIEYLAMLDLDHFKQINDTYGHIFGDDVLRCMGDALQKMQGGADAFRYGGDEFCVVFVDKSLENVIQEIKKVQTYMIENMELPSEEMNICISAGIARYSSDNTVTQLLEQADKALYEAKSNFGNEIIVYEEN